ncbi:hypothetical protein KDA11_01215 [Candidatus Saccharibacteria bacterium]|nr:hypothetical protein [Candidatus Saccharibacteria bacterium]
MGKRLFWNQETFPMIWKESGRGETHELVDYSEVTHAKSKITVRCKACESLLYVRCDHFFSKLSNCSFCKNSTLLNIIKNLDRNVLYPSTYTNEIVELLFKNDSRFDNVTWVNQYEKINSNMSNITYQCNECNHFTNMTLTNLVQSGPHCSICGSHSKWSKEKFLYRYNQLTDSDEYKYLPSTIQTFSGAFDKFVIKHNECGRYWAVSCDNFFTQGTRCPHCLNNTKESIVSFVLDELGLNFEFQWRNHNCVYKRTLVFDFYIKEKNTIIEYNGPQHYKPIEKFGGYEALLYNIERDNCKRAWCKDNNIRLLEIPYFYGTVEDIEWFIKENLNV